MRNINLLEKNLLEAKYLILEKLLQESENSEAKRRAFLKGLENLDNIRGKEQAAAIKAQNKKLADDSSKRWEEKQEKQPNPRYSMGQGSRPANDDSDELKKVLTKRSKKYFDQLQEMETSFDQNFSDEDIQNIISQTDALKAELDNLLQDTSAANSAIKEFENVKELAQKVDEAKEKLDATVSQFDFSNMTADPNLARHVIKLSTFVSVCFFSTAYCVLCIMFNPETNKDGKLDNLFVKVTDLLQKGLVIFDAIIGFPKWALKNKNKLGLIGKRTVWFTSSLIITLNACETILESQGSDSKPLATVVEASMETGKLGLEIIEAMWEMDRTIGNFDQAMQNKLREWTDFLNSKQVIEARAKEAAENVEYGLKMWGGELSNIDKEKTESEPESETDPYASNPVHDLDDVELPDPDKPEEVKKESDTVKNVLKTLKDSGTDNDQEIINNLLGKEKFNYSDYDKIVKLDSDNFTGQDGDILGDLQDYIKDRSLNLNPVLDHYQRRFSLKNQYSHLFS